MRAVAFLVSKGHKENDCIHVYSFGKMLEYYRLAIVEDRQRLSDLSVALRMSEHAKGKEFQKYVLSLSEGTETEAERGKADPPEKIRGLMSLMKKR